MTAAIWHDLECGGYQQDLPLWLGLAGKSLTPGQFVLDVGAGTGRVSLALARAGHGVVALDSDPELLAALEQRAAGLKVETLCADARTFALPGRSFPLILVPMQTLQLLGGPDGHLAFLRRARAHLAPGGLVAVAVAAADDFEEFHWREGDPSPLPDIAEHGDCSYFSQPTAVRRERDVFVLERRRETVDAEGRRSREENRIALDIVSADGLAEAGQRAGLRQLGVQDIHPTHEHIGSKVVILGD